MGTTTNMGFRYPSGAVGVAPDVAGDIHNLAADIDGAFAATAIDRTPADGNYVGDWNNATKPGAYRIFAGNGNANSPLAGTGVEAAYGYGTLIVSSSGQSVTQIYAEHGSGTESLWWRTAWSGTNFNAWQHAVSWEMGAYSGTVTVTSGFTANRLGLIRYGRMVTLDFSATRTGGTITGTPSGNIVNVVVGNIGSWRPQLPYAPLAAGPGGPTCSFAVDNTNGNILLAAMPPSYNLVNGQEITCGGTFITNA